MTDQSLSQSDSNEASDEIENSIGCFAMHSMARGKSLLESWVTTFVPDQQPPLIFSVANTPVILM